MPNEKPPKKATKLVANGHTKSAPQLAPVQSPNSRHNVRLGSANPRSRHTTPRRTAKTLSPVSKNKPKRAADANFLQRLASRNKLKMNRPKTAGPITCSATGRWSRPGGGRFSTAKPKTETDWIIKRSRETPGPGQYTPKYIRRNRAVKISNANPKSDVDLVILRSKETPGPSEYKPRAIGRERGVKMSDANPKSELDWIIHRSLSTPG